MNKYRGGARGRCSDAVFEGEETLARVLTGGRTGLMLDRSRTLNGSPRVGGMTCPPRSGLIRISLKAKYDLGLLSP